MRTKRKISDVTTSKKEYKILTNQRLSEPYWDDGAKYHKRGKKYTDILTFEYRSYRSWKYNRKTQYKL